MDDDAPPDALSTATVPAGGSTLPALPVLFAGADAADLPELVARLEDYARASAGAFAANTVRALAADTRVFAAWCRAQGHRPLPAPPATVAAFIDHQAARKAPATVARYRSSVAALHRAAGLDNPCNAEVVRLAIRRMNRTYGTRQKQAEPLNRPSVDRMLKEKTTPRLHRRLAEAARRTEAVDPAEVPPLAGAAHQAAAARHAEKLRAAAAPSGQAGRPSSPVIGLRNAALVAIAYDTLLRRAELVALRVEDLAAAEDGSGTVLVRSSKGDQEAVGAIKYLAPDTMGHVAAWLAAAGTWVAPLASGPLFRPVTKGGRVAATALEAQEVRRLFRELAGAAGVKLARLPSGHSTRVGAAQDMLAAGLELGEVMQAGSWKTVTMPARYGERLLARRGAARKLATFQNRA